MRQPTAPAYYDRRADEYDDWYLGRGLFASRDRPGFTQDVGRVIETLAALPPATTLDIACGTGFLTRHLPGSVTGVDQSERMLALAREHVPDGRFIRADALQLPFRDGTFQRVVTAHFYGHLDDTQRPAFLREARRVGDELVVVDASLERSSVEQEWAHRQLNDGSEWEVFTRYFDPEALVDELGGGEALHAGDWFVVVSSPRSARTGRAARSRSRRSWIA